MVNNKSIILVKQLRNKISDKMMKFFYLFGKWIVLQRYKFEFEFKIIKLIEINFCLIN